MINEQHILLVEDDESLQELIEKLLLDIFFQPLRLQTIPTSSECLDPPLLSIRLRAVLFNHSVSACGGSTSPISDTHRLQRFGLSRRGNLT